MADYAQTAPLKVTTPLGPDALLLSAFEGEEALSELFQFTLELQAENETVIAFDKIVGQSVTVELALPEGKSRYFNGIVNEFKQLRRDNTFTYYSAEVVPKFWLLTQNVQSRIFQQQTVPEILHEVFSKLDVSFELLGTYPKHNYCVQLRESDFDFASRLMEEEGIFYYFKHSANGHQLVLADTSIKNPELPDQSSFLFDDTTGGRRESNRINVWQKAQKLCTAHHLLWDHCFELPGQSLEATQSIQSSVQAGTITHQLQLSANQDLQIYDHPGGYAHRFDGIDAGGGEQTSELSSIFQDNQRTVAIRMEQTAADSVVIDGAGDCGAFCPGFKFTLMAHFDGDGDYLLTKVTHSAKTASFRSSTQEGSSYSNTFHCVPSALPYRPPMKTPQPTVVGTQTATVVGPTGEEIFTDKYGRVKVQFHWDRFGQNNINSSCWLRVLHASAGGNWGAIHLPRVGHEVVVAFHEGDPDLPYVAGSVYNAGQMPPFTLPDNRTRSGFKSHSREGGPQNFSGIVFEDQKDAELLQLHSEKDMMTNAENNHVHNVNNSHMQHIGRSHYRTVGGLPGKTTTPAAGSGSGGGKPGQRQQIRLGGKNGKGATVRGSGRKTPPPAPARGSGRGGGESLDFTSPVEWSQPEISGAMGFAYELVIGAQIEATLGWCSEPIIGDYVEVIINPAGALSALGPAGTMAIAALGAIAGAATGVIVGAATDASPAEIAEYAEWGMLVAGTAAVGGATECVFGAKKDLLYGPAYEACHGPKFTFHSHVTIPLGLMAAATAASFAAAVIVPGVMPNEGAATLAGLGISDLNALMLEGLWLAEDVVSTAQAEAKKVAEAAALAKQPVVVPPPTAAELVAAAELRVQAAIGIVADQSAKLATKVSRLQNSSTVAGDFTMNAENYSLTVSPSPAIFGDPAGACNVNILSEGFEQNGTISMSANGQITMSSGAAVLGLENSTPAAGCFYATTGTEGTIAIIRGPVEEALSVPTYFMDPEGILMSGGELPIVIYSGEVIITINPESGTILLEAPNIELVAEELISFTVDDTELSIDPEGIQLLAMEVVSNCELELDENITAKSQVCAEDSEENALTDVM